MKFESCYKWDQAVEPSLPATFTQLSQATSAVVVQTQNGTPLQPHTVKYFTSMYPGFYLSNMMNPSLSQTMCRSSAAIVERSS